jgi:putative ABC transport system ATP-binding protein
VLVAENISFSYNHPLFEGVNIEISPSETVAVVGVSGSGKSTLLNILSTLILPQAGTVFHDGIDIKYRSDIDEFRRKEIGIIFQFHYLFKGFTALENIEAAAILANRDIDYELIRRLGVYDLLGQKVTELSGGQQQRVSIARVLTKQPRFLFADEPTGNLDSKTAYEVMEIIFDYVKADRRILVLVTHDEKLAKKCDKVYRLENQKFERIG